VVTLPTPTPAPAPTPTPSPSATPCPGECATTNREPAVKLTIRLFKVTNSSDELQAGFDEDSWFPPGYKLTIDAVAKDANKNETLGEGDILFEVSNPKLVKVGGTQHTFQRKITVLSAGTLQVWAFLDGVQSNVLTFKLSN
jgi:hypothetical protein